MSVREALLVVVAVYLLTVLIIWLLNLIAPMNGSVEGTVQKSGFVVWFAAAGATGAFMLLAGLAILAVRWLTKRDA
jgi:hypothetical protein